jgi:predicted aspartyl protease
MGDARLMLDTGADRTMLSPAALMRLGIPVPTTRDTSIKSLTASIQVPMTWIRSVAVGNATVGPLRIWVHDAELNDADGVLGRDFLNHLNVMIENSAGHITLSPK